MREFRIVPRQAPERTTSGHRGFGFLFEGNVMCWPDFKTADIAAYILKVRKCDIVPVGVLIPSSEPYTPVELEPYA